MNDTAVLLRGIPMRLYEYEAVSEAIRQSGDFYEAAILDDLARRFPVHRVIVDAGANIGNHALYWSAFASHQRILAFEPIASNFELLAENLADWPRALSYRIALSDSIGYLRMSSDEVNMGRCRVSGDGEISVPCARLDPFVEGEDVTLIKIDTEGHEAQVAAGSARMLARCHPAVIIEDEPGTFGETLHGLGLFGYRLTAEYPGRNFLWEWRA